MFKLDSGDMVALRRLAEIHAVIEREGDEVDSTYFDEFCTLQAEIVPKVMPLMEKLVKAGILYGALDFDQSLMDEIYRQNYRQGQFTARVCYQNGGIILDLDPSVVSALVATKPLRLPKRGPSRPTGKPTPKKKRDD